MQQKYIVMTLAEAHAAVSQSKPSAALIPAALEDGTFVLPHDVLQAPEHAAAVNILAALPTRTMTDEQYRSEATAAAHLAAIGRGWDVALSAAPLRSG